MNTHFRNYSASVNGKVIPPFLTVGAISNQHIELAKEEYRKQQIKCGRIQETDKIIFRFKYCHT